MSSAYWSWAALYVMTPVVGITTGRVFNRLKSGSLAKPFEGQSVLFSLGVVLALLTLWPLVIVGLVLDSWITSFGYCMDRHRDLFHSRPEHLIGSLSVSNAEANAVVIDPLHRAPDQPFGHLNAAWEEFKQKKKFWYRLQKFGIPGTPPDAGTNSPQWSTPHGRKLGYAWVGLGRIKAEFIYEWD